MERKLRPIWEALDVRNNKQALKLCNALIQKHPAVIIAKVFKALSLVRMGRREEALECMSEVKALKPTDDQVLSTMAMAYKELGEPHIAVTCYEDAWAVDPNNIEIGMQLFFNYAKQCDSVKMQQIAMKLYKQSTKAEHLFWSIASILLQTIDNQVSSGSDAKRMLAVAEGMLLKAHKDGKINNWEALQLYEDVLIQQGKYQNALDVASGPLGDLCPMPAVRLSQRASLLLRLENFAHSNRLYQQLLTKHDADDWAYHVGYLDTLLRLAQTSSQRVQSKPTTETSDQESPYKAHRSVEEGRNFIKQLQQQQESEPISGRKRGPFLAELELEYRLLLAHSETDDAKAVNGGDFEQQQKGRLTLAMVDYYVRFGTRPVCFGDLRPYLVHIASTPTWASDLHNRILAAVPAAASIVHPSALKEQGVRSEDDVRYSLCALFVERVLGVVPSSTTTEQVSGLCDLYDASLALGENLERRERRVGDDALLLVAHILLDRYNSTWDAQHVIDAVVVLEYGMQQSAYNFQFQLLLMRLYLQLGASRPAKHLHARLQLKHIQHDTLSHLVLPDLLRCGDVPTAKKICESIERFHRDAIRDIGENLVVALRQGTLSKVREFVELGLQLQSSAMRSLAAASWINIHLIAKALDLHAATLLFADTHSFPRPDPHGVEVGAAKAKWNDDLQVLVSWNRNTPRSTSAPSQSPSPSPSPDASLTTPPPMGSPTFPVSYRPVPETDADREEIARMHSALALHSLSENRLLWLKVTIAQQTLMRSAMDGTGVGVVAGARPAVHMWPLISMLGATLHSLRVILYEPPSSSSPSPSPSPSDADASSPLAPTPRPHPDGDWFYGFHWSLVMTLFHTAATVHPLLRALAEGGGGEDIAQKYADQLKLYLSHIVLLTAHCADHISSHLFVRVPSSSSTSNPSAGILILDPACLPYLSAFSLYSIVWLSVIFQSWVSALMPPAPPPSTSKKSKKKAPSDVSVSPALLMAHESVRAAVRQVKEAIDDVLQTAQRLFDGAIKSDSSHDPVNAFQQSHSHSHSHDHSHSHGHGAPCQHEHNGGHSHDHQHSHNHANGDESCSSEEDEEEELEAEAEAEADEQQSDAHTAPNSRMQSGNAGSPRWLDKGFPYDPTRSILPSALLQRLSSLRGRVLGKIVSSHASSLEAMLTVLRRRSTVLAALEENPSPVPSRQKTGVERS